jgi:hypothetical protein
MANRYALTLERRDKLMPDGGGDVKSCGLAVLSVADDDGVSALANLNAIAFAGRVA